MTLVTDGRPSYCACLMVDRVCLQDVFAAFFQPILRQLQVKLKLSKNDFTGKYPNPKWRAFSFEQLESGRYVELPPTRVIVAEDDIDWTRPLTDEQLQLTRQVSEHACLT